MPARGGRGNRIDLTGTRAGMLTVVSPAEDVKKGVASWNCICDCGNAHVATAGNLNRPDRPNVSCGCSKGKFITNKKRKQPFEGLYNFFVSVSKRRGYSVQVSFEQFLEFTKIDRCHYCGTCLEWLPHREVGTKGGWRYNLDRKDNSKGYSVDNCVTCCRRCNMGKGRWYSHEEWVKMTAVFRHDNEEVDCQQN